MMSMSLLSRLFLCVLVLKEAGAKVLPRDESVAPPAHHTPSLFSFFTSSASREHGVPQVPTILTSEQKNSCKRLRRLRRSARELINASCKTQKDATSKHKRGRKRQRKAKCLHITKVQMRSCLQDDGLKIKECVEALLNVSIVPPCHTCLEGEF